MAHPLHSDPVMILIENLGASVKICYEQEQWLGAAISTYMSEQLQFISSVQPSGDLLALATHCAAQCSTCEKTLFLWILTCMFDVILAVRDVC